MKRTTIYRIQHKSGKGMFHAHDKDGVCYYTSHFPRRIYEEIFSLHRTSDFPALCYDDRLRDLIYDLSERETKQLYFAYNNLDKLKSAIKPHWIPTLLINDFRIYEIEILENRIYQSQYQTMFFKKHIIKRTDITEKVMKDLGLRMNMRYICNNKIK